MRGRDNTGIRSEAAVPEDFKAYRKGDTSPNAITVSDSAVQALGDARKITGLPRDNFAMREITREEFERFRTEPYDPF